MPRLGVKVHTSPARLDRRSAGRLFWRLLTSFLLVGTATIHVVANEDVDASSLAESEALRDWLKASQDGGPGRSRAVEAFGRVCCHGDEGVFLEAIGLAQEEGRIIFLLRDAIEHELRKGNKGTLALLASALRHSDPAVRRTVADVLVIGPAAREMVPTLANALEDEDAGVRGRVARAIGSIGPPADEAIPALVAELVKERGSILSIPMEARKDAANALGMIGEAAVP